MPAKTVESQRSFHKFCVSNINDLIEDISTDETSVVEGEQPSVARRTSSRNKKQTERFGEAIPTNLLKKEGRCDISRSGELSNLS